jgi:hypothetical protein
MAPEGQKPSKWLCLTKLPREMYSQPIVHKALSWGAIRKSACILAEITIRKSHPLEGSCQEAILIPYTTFDIFSLRSARHTLPPIGALRRIRVFMPVASALMRRTSHPSGSRPRDVSLLRQTSAPGIFDAPENPRFPAVSNRVPRTDRMAPSRVHLFQGSRQRRRNTQPFGGRPCGMG